jgi:hypothetical protein
MAQRPIKLVSIGGHFWKVESVIAWSAGNEQREEIECTRS